MTRPVRIPSIERLRQRVDARAIEARVGPGLLVDALREEAAAWRRRLHGGRQDAPEDDAAIPRTDEALADRIVEGARGRVAVRLTSRLQPVINATGVVVHTNLGRAPLSDSALARVADVARGYATLEFDLATGIRGSRDVHAEPLLCALTGAPAAVVVNNNAAATMLMLAALAAGREVVVSRGELVEIGGGFRVPDILAQSGAVLREVGTTNRTRLSDYGAAIGPKTALILRVHPSNFRIEGFTTRPSVDELADLARQTGVSLVEDLGSGFIAPQPELFDASGAAKALAEEPSVQASLAAGVEVVAFSGDKLLGGPQAGILVGRHDELERIRRHPLMRALRCDKMTYAALEATLIEYVTGRAASTVPVARMLAMPTAVIHQRAERLTAALARARPSPSFTVSIESGASTIGGGSAPGSRLPTALVLVRHPHIGPNELATRLRTGRPPVIARIVDDSVALDLRTVFADQDAPLVQRLATLDQPARQDAADAGATGQPR